MHLAPISVSEQLEIQLCCALELRNLWAFHESSNFVSIKFYLEIFGPPPSLPSPTITTNPITITTIQISDSIMSSLMSLSSRQSNRIRTLCYAHTHRHKHNKSGTHSRRFGFLLKIDLRTHRQPLQLFIYEYIGRRSFHYILFII